MSKENIIALFYIEHLKVKEIAEKEHFSSAYITKVIKNDPRYMQEKEYRANISKEKRKTAKNKFAKDKRDKQKIEDNYSFVQEQHKQASKELSKSSHISNENYRKWNYSAYKYNPSKRRYEFDSSLGRSYDVPKYIKERWNSMEEKLLKIFKLADSLNEKQDKVFAQIEYSANNSKKLELAIRSKTDYSYVEKCEVHLTNDSLIRWDNVIKLFEDYIRDTKKIS